MATGWSGQLDFLVDEDGQSQFYNVAFDLQPVQKEVVWKGVLIENSMWAYPRETSAKEQMRLCYENAKAGTIMWNNSLLAERFSAGKMYEQFVAELSDWVMTEDDEEGLSSMNKQEVLSLKDKHQGETCYIFGCGPSLKDFFSEADQVTIENLYKNHTIVTIKQSYLQLRNKSHYHFLIAIILLAIKRIIICL